MKDSRIKTVEGVTIAFDDEGFDIIASEKIWKDLRRRDVYIEGLSLELSYGDLYDLKIAIEKEIKKRDSFKPKQ